MLHDVALPYKVGCCGSVTHRAEIIGEVWIAGLFWVPALRTEFCPLDVIANLVITRQHICSVTLKK